MLKKVLGGLAVAFILFFIITNPDGAAAVVGSIGGGLATAARAFGRFFTKLAS